MSGERNPNLEDAVDYMSELIDGNVITTSNSEEIAKILNEKVKYFIDYGRAVYPFPHYRENLREIEPIIEELYTNLVTHSTMPRNEGALADLNTNLDRIEEILSEPEPDERQGGYYKRRRKRTKRRRGRKTKRHR